MVHNRSQSTFALVAAFCGLVSVAGVATSPASAARVIAGSANAASLPPGGTPLVVWNGDFFSTGSPGALSPSRQLLPFPGSGTVNVATAPAGARTVLAAEPYVSSGALTSAGVFFGDTGMSGRARFTRVLPESDAPRVPVIAGSTAGDALLAWNHQGSTAVDRMAPGSGLRPPVLAGRFSIHDAAIDGSGTATVVGYNPGSHLLVSAATRHGRFGPVTALSPTSASAARVSSGTGGQTAVVALSQAGGLQLFYRPRPNTPFAATENLASASAAVVGTAVDAHGRVLVAWTEPDANNRIRLRAMITDETGHPTPSAALSAAGDDVLYGDAAVAMNEAGDVAAVWEESTPGGGNTSEGPPHVYASLRPAGGQFGPARQVTPLGRQAAPAGRPVVALGSDATAVLVWADSAEGTNDDQRSMTARLTSSGLTDVTRLDTGSAAPANAPTTPPLLQATLHAATVQRVRPSSGRLHAGVRCISWTLAPCRGHILIKDRSGQLLTPNHKVSVHAGLRSTFTLQLNRASRRALKSGRGIHATLKVTLTGASTRSSSKSIVIRPR